MDHITYHLGPQATEGHILARWYERMLLVCHGAFALVAL